MEEEVEVGDTDSVVDAAVVVVVPAATMAVEVVLALALVLAVEEQTAAVGRVVTPTRAQIWSANTMAAVFVGCG